MIAFLVVFAIVALTFIHYRKKFNVWKAQNVRGPAPIPIFGNFADSLFKPMQFVDMERANKYGRIYGVYDGTVPSLVVSDPDLLKQVLVKNFNLFPNRRPFEVNDPIAERALDLLRDEEWKRIRSIVTPTFSSGKIRRMKPLIMQCVQNTLHYLDEVAARNEHLNLKSFWDQFTLSVIAKCCFALNVNFHKHPDKEFIKHVSSIISLPLIPILCLFLLPEKMMKMFKIRVISSETINYFRSLVLHILNERNGKKENYNDFLELLIEAEHEVKRDNLKHKSLTENELVAQCILFFAAGYETTATLLQFACYTLAVFPDIQQKLFEEISSESFEQEIDYDRLNELQYLDAFINETLRKYPPAVRIEREAKEEVNLIDYGIKMPAKSIVTIPIYAIHHDNEFFEDAEKFVPERFLPENRDKIKAYTYLPFGGGQRICAAMRFALIEAKLALYYVVKNFRFEKCKYTAFPPVFKNSPLILKSDLIVSIFKR